MKLYTLYIGGSGYYGALYGTRAQVKREAKRLADGHAWILQDEDGKDVI